MTGSSGAPALYPRSGIHGTIKKIKEDVVTLQIADNVRIKIERSAIGKVRE